MADQKTLATLTELRGVGLHSGEDVSIELRPAEVDTGIVFRRMDITGQPTVRACVENLTLEPRRSALAHGDAVVHTPEHLMAALGAVGIDNLEVRLSNCELPGMDGSALPYYQAVRTAGVRTQGKPAREICLEDSLSVQQNGASVVAMPHDAGLKVGYVLDYSATGFPSAQHVGTQFFELQVDEDTFAREIAPARTFVLQEEVDALRAAGLGKGANTRNTVVLGPNGVVENELRFPDEFVRHKVLDLIGDLYLLGCRVRGRVLATKSGHALNVQFARQVLSYKEQKREARLPVATDDAARRAAREQEVAQILGRGADIGSTEIERLMPHRYPFLLLDRVVEIDDRRAVGLKNVTYNEEFFRGHFPERPMMPGVLQVEAMAQLGGLLLLRRAANIHRLAVLLSMDGVKFRKPVVPGDQLILEAKLTKDKSRTAEVEAKATVDGNVAVEARIRFMLVNR